MTRTHSPMKNVPQSCQQVIPYSRPVLLLNRASQTIVPTPPAAWASYFVVPDWTWTVCWCWGMSWTGLIGTALWSTHSSALLSWQRIMVFDLCTPTIFELMSGTVLLMYRRLVQHSLFLLPFIISLNDFVLCFLRHYLLLKNSQQARLMVLAQCLPE